MTNRYFRPIRRRFIKRLRIPLGRITCVLILLFAALSPKGNAQTTEELLDSAILYERLKVTHIKLKEAYVRQERYSMQLEKQLQQCESDKGQMREMHKADLAAERKRRKKTRWRSFGWGVVATKAAEFILKIVTH